MRGFLHRIAAGVVRPQPKLHPFVESIYPAVRAQSVAEPSISHDAFSTVAPVEQIAAHNPHSEVQREETRSSIPPVSQRVLLSRQEVEAQVTPTQSTRQIDGADSGSLPSPKQLPVAASHELQSEAVSHAIQEFVPIILDRVSTTALSDSDKPAKVFTQGEVQAASGRVNGRRQAGQISIAPSAQQQADDIQIHIGRIEVVAIPQPAPRPAPAPTRKGLSLDEYLSRRNGRSG
jgi:hypothetical protein